MINQDAEAYQKMIMKNKKKLEEEKYYNGCQNIIYKKYKIINWFTISLVLLF